MLATVLAVSLVAGAGVVGCERGGYTGPTEADLLPEASLSFPGATERRRSFLEASDARGIDGNDLSGPARLSRTLDLGPGTPLVEVLSWYRERLVGAGWTRNHETREGIHYGKAVGSRDHRYSVQSRPGPDGAITGYAVEYFMT